MNIYLDIETLPDQSEGAYERHLEESMNNFKAPSGMTKGQMLADLKGRGREYDKDGKFTSADQVKLDWAEVMKKELN